VIWRAVASAGLERGLYHPLRLLPSERVTAVGAWLGRRVVPGLYPEATARAREALRRLRPDLDPDAALAEAWANIAATFAETARILVTTFLPPVALPAPTGDAKADTAVGAAALDAVLDPVVRERLPQWLHLIGMRWGEEAPLGATPPPTQPPPACGGGRGPGAAREGGGGRSPPEGG
jgi:lauroyl/myristoyl acyltransferase